MVARDGLLSLELIGTFSDDAAAGLTFQRNRYPLLSGWLSKGGPISLLSCSGIESFNSPGISTEKISFVAAIKGHQFESPEELFFDSVTAHVSDLSTWLGIHGLESTFPVRDNASTAVLWSARYVQPSPIQWTLPDGTEICVRFTASFPATSGRGDVTLLQDCQVQVSSPTQETLFELRKRVNDLVLLFKLLSGFKMQTTLGSISRKQVVSEDEGVFLHPLINRRPSSEPEPSKPEPYEVLVPFSDIAGRMQICLEKWQEILKVNGGAVRVAMADVRGLPIEMRFTHYANSLLRLHEASTKKKLRFSDVLPDVLGRYCQPSVAVHAADLIEASRHYFTHFNPELVERVAVGAELMNLADLLDLIHRCVLFEEMGFSLDEILDWIDRSFRFKDHLSLDRWYD